MNRKIILNLFFLSLSLLLASCNNKDDDMPNIPLLNLQELGSGHDSSTDNTAFIGSDLHISAEVVADGVIGKIEVSIEQEDGDYKIEKAYADTKYVGNKNAHFHEHIDIPSDAVVGSYLFSLIVTDKLGQTVKEEKVITIKKANNAV